MTDQNNPEPLVNLNLDFNLGQNLENPLVTVGVVNCNRLHYLRSCLESFLECTQDYENKEIVVVDNASTEEGTEEYLTDLEQRGCRVIRMTARDPSNEFARGLNTKSFNTNSHIKSSEQECCNTPLNLKVTQQSG